MNISLDELNATFPSTITLFIPPSETITQMANKYDELANSKRNYFTPDEIKINSTITRLKKNDLIGLYQCNENVCNCDRENNIGYCRIFNYEKWREVVDNKYNKKIVIVI
jgi:hypothetical protein